MKWTVSGADRQTGLEQTMTVEAHSEKEAREQAGRKGFLVESVAPAGRADRTPSRAPSPAAIPSDLRKASDTLAWFGGVVTSLAWITLLVIAVVVVAIIVAVGRWNKTTHSTEDLVEWNRMIFGAAGILSTLALCLLAFLLIGAVLRWMAGLGHAVDRMR